MAKVQLATQYQILRGVTSTGRAPCVVQPTEKPVRVGYLLNEARFLETGGLIKHHETLFLDDRTHDWDWRNGRFFYYSHALGAEDTGDVVVIYETTEVEEESLKNLTREELLMGGFKVVHYPRQEGEFIAKTVLIESMPSFKDRLADDDELAPGMLVTIEVVPGNMVQMCISESDDYLEPIPVHSPEGRELLKEANSVPEFSIMEDGTRIQNTFPTPGAIQDEEQAAPRERI